MTKPIVVPRDPDYGEFGIKPKPPRRPPPMPNPVDTDPEWHWLPKWLRKRP